MPVEAIVIIILTAAAAVGMLVWALVWGRKPRIPDGHRYEAKHAGNKAILVVDKDVESIKNTDGKVNGWLVDGAIYKASSLVEKAAVAMQATELAFKEKGIAKADVDEVIIYFQTDKNFETGGPSWWAAWSKGAAAYSTTAGAAIGPGLPMAVIRSKHMKALEERGQPVIHELVHILNKEAGHGYQHAHDDADLWAGHGADTVEGIGVRQWRDLVESLKDE
jgi:hypothetical protein